MLGQRFKEERQRLGLTQPEMGEVAGAKKRTVIEWEKGNSSPTAVQLEAFAQAGMDITYVVTGKRVEPELPTLTTDQQMLLEAYQALPVAQQKTLLASLLMGEASKQANANSPKEVKKPAAGKISKSRGMNIIGEQNSISVGGDIKG